MVDSSSYQIRVQYNLQSRKIKIMQEPEQQPPKRQPKPKFRSEAIEGHQIHTQHSIQISQQEAYQQLMSNWRHRQRESLKRNFDGQLNTLYTYDPNNPDFSVYQKPVSEEREEIFTKYCVQICCYLKAKYIIEQLIQPIKQNKIFDQEILHNCEFFYLLSFRAWCQINSVLRTFNQRKAKSQNIQKKTSLKRSSSIQKIEFVFNPEHANLKYLVEPMIKLSVKADAIFSYYHRILTLKQHYFKNKIKAFFDFIFHHETKKTHDKFLCGFQGIDFTKQEQIDYFYTNYALLAIQQIKALVGVKFEHISEKLGIYKDLLTNKMDKIQGYDDFETLKKTLINEWKEKMEKNSTQTPTPSSK